MPKGIRNKFTDTTALGALFTADAGSGGGAPAAPAAPSATSPAADAVPAQPATGDADALGDAGKKALDSMKAEKKAAEKRATELETRLKELEDRDKTEAQKLADKATSTEQRAVTAETRATRLEVILDKLPENASAADVKRLVALAPRLVGNTREELEADADVLLATFTTTGGPQRPSGDIGQGPRPPAQITDPRARDLAQIEADLKAGARR